MAAYDFKVDFSPLGTLPQLAQNYREQQATDQALAGLKSGEYKDVREAAAAILRGGGSAATAIKLLTAATQDYAARSRAAEMEAYLKMLPGMQGSMKGLTPPPGTSELPTIPGAGVGAYTAPVPSAEPTPSPAAPPSPFPPPPTTSQIPPGTLGPRTEAAPPPSPTDAIITKAQAGMDPVLAAPATKLAGPPPTPDTAAPMAPSLALQSGQIQAPPQASAPPAAAPAAEGPPPVSAIPNPTNDLRAYQSELEKRIMTLPPKYANSPYGKVLQERLTETLKQLQLSPKEIEYRHALLQAVKSGEAPFTYQEYQIKPQLAEATYKEFQKGYDEVRTKTIQAEDFLQQAERMRTIMNHPDFRSGQGAAAINYATSIVTTLHNSLKAAGVPVPDISQIPNLPAFQRSAALGEAYAALANSALFKTLGGLGRQISDGDRIFMEKAYASLSNTPLGNKLLLDIQMTLARRAVENGRAAESYRQNRPETRATIHGMDKAIRDNTDSNTAFQDSNGNLTEEGKKFQAKIEGIVGQAEAPQPLSSPEAPPRPGVVPRPFFGLTKPF